MGAGEALELDGQRRIDVLVSHHGFRLIEKRKGITPSSVIDV